MAEKKKSKPAEAKPKEAKEVEKVNDTTSKPAAATPVNLNSAQLNRPLILIAGISVAALLFIGGYALGHSTAQSSPDKEFGPRGHMYFNRDDSGRDFWRGHDDMMNNGSSDTDTRSSQDNT